MTPTKFILRLLALILLLVSAPRVQAEEPLTRIQRPFLWTVEHPEIEATSFLFGTIHLPDDRVLDLPRAVTDAIEKSDATFAEISIFEGQLEVMKALMLPEDESLKGILPEDVYKKLDAYLRENGVNIDAFDRMNIWGIISILTSIEYLGTTKLPLDAHLLYLAALEGDETGGLETVKEQMAIFEAFTREEAIEILREALDYLDDPETDMMEEIIQAYLSGDGDRIHRALYAYVDLEKEVDRKFMDIALTQRDVRFAERIDTMMKENREKSFFFAIGTAHLTGGKSVVDKLRARGYKLEQAGPASEENAGAEASVIQEISIVNE